MLDLINGPLTNYFRTKELPISKKTYSNFGNWIEKQNAKLAASFEQDEKHLIEGS